MKIRQLADLKNKTLYAGIRVIICISEKIFSTLTKGISN
jgi:hypothetical protein